ncbi:hypothetical protein [Microbacterium alkaliflavum]|uniref:hypothetical protein n=1 Tax=Microbacterium alkaliflavum TaxID=3248839 RepID=UPI0037CA8C25
MGLWNAIYETFEEAHQSAQHAIWLAALRRLYTDHYGDQLGRPAEEYQQDAFERLHIDIAGVDWADTADALEALYNALAGAKTRTPLRRRPKLGSRRGRDFSWANTR